MPSVALTLLRSKQGLRFAAASLLCVSLFAQHGHGHDAAAEKKPEAPARTLGDYALVAADGKPLPLSAYKGKIVLIVNIASHSQYSGQVAALSRLQDEDRDKGLVVIGVPSNDFGKSEPGTDAEIQKHYKDELHATFLVTAKSTFTGVHELPAFVFLTGGAPDGKPGEPVHWNFTKFIVGRDGQVLARYAPDVAPDDPEFRIAIEKALDGRLKPKEGDKGGAKPAAGDDDDDDGPDV